MGRSFRGEGVKGEDRGQRKRNGRERGADEWIIAESSSQVPCGGGALALIAQVWLKYDLHHPPHTHITL